MTRKKEREKTDEFLTAGQADRSGVEAIRTQRYTQMVDMEAGFLTNLPLDRIHCIRGGKKSQ